MKSVYPVPPVLFVSVLKSDLRGIEISHYGLTKEEKKVLKSDLRGIEISLASSRPSGPSWLKSDLRGIEIKTVFHVNDGVFS